MKIEGDDLKEYHWPYSCINKADLLAQIISVENILQKYGAVYIEDFCEKGKWILSDGSYVYETIQKHIWKRKNEYICVDRLYFSEKPFLVLEFSANKEGPHEDADPFPYDLSNMELEQEIRYSLGIETACLSFRKKHSGEIDKYYKN